MKELGFKWDSRGVQFVELLIDLGIVVFGLFMVMYSIEDFDEITIRSTLGLFQELVVTHSVLLILSLIFFRVYKTTITKYGFWTVMPKIFLALIMANVITAFVSLLMPTLHYSIQIFFYSLTVQLILLCIFKYLIYILLSNVNSKTAIVIGPEEQVKSIASKLIIDRQQYIKLRYLVYEDNNDLNQLNEIYEYISGVDCVYLTSDLIEKKKNAIIAYCIDKDKTIFLVPKIYELAIIKSNIDQIGDVLAFSIKSMSLSFEQKIIKRIFDLIVSIIGLVLSSPILLFFAILIKLQDGGKVFFIQKRLTKDNKPFNLIKFRTMVPNAEKLTGPVLATDKDPRITKLGKFMRKTRIDELPQFINIIKGEMSIVGPRPERPYFVDKFVHENPNYRFRLNVKAGVTGLAQALGKYNTSYEDKLRFDLYYIRNYSFLYDVSILLHTIRAVFDRTSTEGINIDNDFLKLARLYGFLVLEDEKTPDIKIIVKK